MKQELAAPDDVLYVADETGLSRVMSAVESVPRVAVDTEADSLHHYFEKVCLIQLNAGGKFFIVDPLRGLNLAPLISLLEERTLIFHGADYDIRLLSKCYGMVPRHVFDTKIAVQLLGYANIGLAAQVMVHFGVHLSKAAQKMDWSRRPLTPKMLHYAGNDVRYLLSLGEMLDRELLQSGRVIWCAESCEAMLSASLAPTEKDSERVWRIKGSTGLGRQGMAVVKSLWYWRDEQARQADLPTFRIISNDELIALAAWVLANRGQSINEYQQMPKNFSSSRISSMQKIITEALMLKPPAWPHYLKGERQETVDKVLVDLLKQRRNEIAEEVHLDPPLLASHQTLSLIARAFPASREELHRASLMNQWQVDLLAGPFLDVIAGYEHSE